MKDLQECNYFSYLLYTALAVKCLSLKKEERECMSCVLLAYIFDQLLLPPTGLFLH